MDELEYTTGKLERKVPPPRPLVGEQSYAPDPPCAPDPPLHPQLRPQPAAIAPNQEPGPGGHAGLVGSNISFFCSNIRPPQIFIFMFLDQREGNLWVNWFMLVSLLSNRSFFLLKDKTVFILLLCLSTPKLQQFPPLFFSEHLIIP